MRILLLVCSALAGSLALCHPAKAQWAVIDSANIGQSITNAGREVAQMVQQYKQLQQQYQMFTHPSDVIGIFPGLNSPFLQNPMPPSSTIPTQIFGSGSMTPNAQAFYSLNHIFTATGNDAQAQYLNRSSVAAANIQGIAATNLQSIEQRLATLNEMQKELQGASDIKQVAAIHARIEIEANAIQAQQSQAQNLLTLASTQTQADQQGQLAAIRQGHEQAAALFNGALAP